MQATVGAVADRVLALYKSTPPDRRVLVGIAGVPGSGKSTLAYPLVDRLNFLLSGKVEPTTAIDSEGVIAVTGTPSAAQQIAVAVGLDGWHHTREALTGFPDPAEAQRRRGAAFTFDAAAYVAFVRSLRSQPFLDTLPFPNFDHALKDPTPSPVPILPTHHIVVIEGLYTLLDVAPWTEAVEKLDERIWVEADRKVARRRLVARHLQTRVETELGAAESRVDLSDMLNGEYIREHLFKPTLRISSQEDPSFAAAAQAVQSK
ncbi:hypothetical protein JCM11641_000447 [Rhodosporidiobolus odoratus]